MKIKLEKTFEDIVCLENLLKSWKEFERGKKNRKDVEDFSMRLMDNIFSLHQDLSNYTYNHGNYQAFKINDPKPRDIHKASVCDRLLHHAIYRILYPFFDKTFIADSYSCRNDKGTHKAIDKFSEYADIVSKNNTKTCWVLKCDIRKFFANIDHQILINILGEYIPDKNIMNLLKNIIESFNISKPPPAIAWHWRAGLLNSPLNAGEGAKMIGLPLGNLTSQLFVNIYMNKFDQFAKHKMKAKYYIRYADDFVFVSQNKNQLENQISVIEEFLKEELKLEMHPDKVFIKTFSSGVDFLGMVNFSKHRILRTKTKRRMIAKLSSKHKMYREDLVSNESPNQSLQSYLGVLKHCEGWKIEENIRKW